MKSRTDDPKLTAYALGELDDEERREVDKRLEQSSKAREALEEIRETVALLRTGFEGEPALAQQATGVYRPPGEAHFHLRTVPGATRLRLRRRLDADHAGQEAEIRVNGYLAGRFPPEDRNSERRWREISIDLPPPADNRSGKVEFTITALARPGILPPEDSTFTAFTYELWTEVSPQLFADGFQPTGIKATDGNFSDRVRVTFNSVPGAVVYRVYRCLTTAEKCGSPIGFPKTGVFDDKMTVSGQVYYYRVRACTRATCGKYSIADPGYRVHRCPTAGPICGLPIELPQTGSFDDMDAVSG